MLKIRNAQMQAMQAMDLQDLAASVIGLLRRKYAAQLCAVSNDYLESLLEQSAIGCEQQGLETQGELIEFAEMLVLDDRHPLDSGRLIVKREQVMRELAARELFQRLQALTAATRGIEANQELVAASGLSSNEE